MSTRQYRPIPIAKGRITPQHWFHATRATTIVDYGFAPRRVSVVTRKIVIELCPTKMKPEETLVAVRSDSDV